MSTVAADPSSPLHHRGRAKDVLVIGGRASGTAAVVHLVHSLAPGDRITVVDPQDDAYPSVFHDTDPLLITNTSHDINSLFPDRPGDFLEFLDESEKANAVPRYVVGRYCRKRFAEACKLALERGIDVLQIKGQVKALTGISSGYDLVLEDGNQLYASDVIVAVGVGDVRRPPELTGMSPYPSHQLRQKAGRHVLVVGQGQSGIESALVLCSSGAKVTMCSRSGLFPAVRTRTPFYPFQGTLPVEGPVDFRRLVDEYVQLRGFAPLREQLAPSANPVSMLRNEACLAGRDLCPWQDAIVGIIVAIIDAGLPVIDDKEFLWRYVTSINLPIAHRLLAYLDMGRIDLATLESVKPAEFDFVVTATGFSLPPMYCRGRTLHFGGNFSQDKKVEHLSPDLRFILSDSHGPERIWAVGPASGIRVPFANFFLSAARQASRVAHQISRQHAMA